MVPEGRAPFVVTSLPEGSEIEIFKALIAPAFLDGTLSAVSAAKARAEVEARTAVVVPPQVPVA